MTAAIATKIDTDSEYDHLVSEISDRFAELGPGDVFTTDATGLWEAYLDSFSLAERQYHTCNACRHFIERFGGLVTLDESGKASSALWSITREYPVYGAAIDRLRKVAERTKVTGVFMSSLPVLGMPKNWDPERGIYWTHFHAAQSKAAIHRDRLKTASQAMAEKSEDHKNVMRALHEYTEETVAQAVSLLESDALYRAEKVIGPAKWLMALHESVKTGNRSNKVWRAIAKAPAGFCHPRSSMIGTLLDDIASGMSGDEVARRFREKMHPLQYQRPTAAPSTGNVKQAEEIVAKLGIARSLERRFARLDEVEKIWAPISERPTESSSVFGHLLKPKPNESLTVTARTPITFAKFRRDIMPRARSISMVLPMSGSYAAMVTAQNADAPPILQWDTDEQRNPVSWFMFVGGSPKSRWSLGGKQTARVTAVCDMPPVWFGREDRNQESDRAFIVLDGCQPQHPHMGNCLFPEILKSELHAVRSTIEAYSKSADLPGHEDATACGYIVGNRSPATLDVTDSANVTTRYTIDRWE